MIERFFSRNDKVDVQVTRDKPGSRNSSNFCLITRDPPLEARDDAAKGAFAVKADLNYVVGRCMVECRRVGARNLRDRTFQKPRR